MAKLKQSSIKSAFGILAAKAKGRILSIEETDEILPPYTPDPETKA